MRNAQAERLDRGQCGDANTPPEVRPNAYFAFSNEPGGGVSGSALTDHFAVQSESPTGIQNVIWRGAADMPLFSNKVSLDLQSRLQFEFEAGLGGDLQMLLTAG
jgi:hypothetical protein